MNRTFQWHQDTVAGVIILLITLFLFIKTFSITAEAAMFPQVLLILLALFSISIIATGLKKGKMVQQGHKLTYEGEEDDLSIEFLKGPLSTFFIVMIYCVLISIIGFFPATAIFLTIYLWYRQIKDWKIYLLLVVGFNLFIYFVFVYQLNVPLPTGFFN